MKKSVLEEKSPGLDPHELARCLGGEYRGRVESRHGVLGAWEMAQEVRELLRKKKK